ncbi:MAG TPA: hypothetical protein DCP20_10105, partial [Coriobacteriia bacterium]|nr:hypothetical protein [Coriobacteriia bacterium]
MPLVSIGLAPVGRDADRHDRWCHRREVAATDLNAADMGVLTPGLWDPRRISMLLEGAPFPAALWSGSELRFTWMNTTFLDLLGEVRPRWDLLGMPVKGFLSDSRSASRFIDVA